MENTKELTGFQKLMSFLFFPQIIANIFNALAMDDKGYSLKKILACYGTWVAAEVTLKYACKENSIAFVIIWLAWVGILVGIYSISDISSAVTKIKGSNTPENNENKTS